MKFKQNTHHGRPLQFVSLTPAAPQPAAKVAKIKKQSPAQSPHSCDALGVCQAKACGGCQDPEAKRDAKQAAAMAAADAAEAVYWQGWADFEAGQPLAANPHLDADAMHWPWREGWLDAQAMLGHPPAPRHADLARQHFASAMLALLAGAVVVGVMVWHSARVDGKLAAAPAAQTAVTAGVRQ